MLFLFPIGAVAAHQFIKIHLMSVKVRAVYTGILGLSADCYTTSAAHAGTIYHNRVQRYNGLYVIGLCGLTDKLHHRNRANGDYHIILLAAIQLFFQNIGHKSLCSIGAVIGAHIQIVAACPEFVFQNYNILVPEAYNRIYLQAQAVQMLCLGISDCASNAAADYANRLCALREFRRNAQRPYQIQDSVSCFQGCKLTGALPGSLKNQGNGSALAVIVRNSQRNALTKLIQP